ncbi:hypothetical protein AVEN_51706-1 [Araneus ventricosus]|uniref:Uncharacterized protein n=1 Tax=Araneus ventricosus TaxID=182803 RepID=A0A4Y2GGI6_ARAVE|nr:hypothetical protein AVEN_51706-1 [Araneus ventricosus]
MGKSSRNREEKRKNSKKPASNKGETAPPSASNKTQVKIDGNKVTKGSRRSADEIQAACNFPQIVTEGTDDKVVRNTSAGDIKVSEQSTHSKESDITDKEMREMVEAIQVSMRNMSSTQYQVKPSPLFESKKDFYSSLNAQRPELAENTQICVRLKKDHKRYQELSNILKSSDVMSETGAEPEIYRVLGTLKEVANDTAKQIMATVPKVEDDAYEVTTDLGNDDGKNVEINDGDGSVDDIQEVTHSLQKLTLEEKDGNSSTGNIQETEKSTHNMELEYDDEALIKIIDGIDESTRKAKAGSEIKHTNEMGNVCPRQNKSFPVFERDLKKYLPSLPSKSANDMEKRRSIESVVKILKEKHNLNLSDKKMTAGKAEELEEIKASKEQVDQINDSIIEVKKVEGKEYDSSADHIDVTRKSPQNATEDKKGKEDIDISNDNIQDFHSRIEMSTLTQETENCKRKDKDKIIYPEGTQILPVGDFQHDLNEFMKLQISKLDEQVKKYNDMRSELMFTEEQRVLFSSEREPITAVSKTESHDNIGDTTDSEDENIQEVVESAELDDEPDEIVVELEKNDDIHFEFETNGNKHIFAGDQYYYYLSEEKQGIIFNFKDESIQVFFIGNQVFVSTQNSEFDISVRKSNPVNSTDEATQIDTLP